MNGTTKRSQLAVPEAWSSPDQQASSMLHAAASAATTDALVELLARSGTHRVTTNATGETPHHIAADMPTTSNLTILCAAFGCPSTIDIHGNTVLHRLVQNRILPTMRKAETLLWILQNNASASKLLNIRNADRATVLDCTVAECTPRDAATADLQLVIFDYGGKLGRDVDTTLREALVKDERKRRDGIIHDEISEVHTLMNYFRLRFFTIAEWDKFSKDVTGIIDDEAAMRRATTEMRAQEMEALRFLFTQQTRTVIQRLQVETEDKAATRIQRVWKMALSKRQVMDMKAAREIVVSAARGLRYRLQLAFAWKVVKVQKACRAILSLQLVLGLRHRKWKSVLKSGRTILAFWKHAKLSKRLTTRRNEKMEQILLWKNTVANDTDDAARTLQKWYRHQVSNRRLRVACHAVSIVQAHCRGVNSYLFVFRKWYVAEATDIVRGAMRRRLTKNSITKFVERHVAQRTKLRVEALTKQIGHHMWRENFVASLSQTTKFREITATGSAIRFADNGDDNQQPPWSTPLMATTLIVGCGGLLRYYLVLQAPILGIDLSIIVYMACDVVFRGSISLGTLIDAAAIVFASYGLSQLPSAVVFCVVPLATLPWRMIAATMLPRMHWPSQSVAALALPMVVLVFRGAASSSITLVESLAVWWVVAAAATVICAASMVNTWNQIPSQRKVNIPQDVLTRPSGYFGWLVVSLHQFNQAANTTDLADRVVQWCRNEWTASPHRRVGHLIVLVSCVAYEGSDAVIVPWLFGAVFVVELLISVVALNGELFRHKAEILARVLVIIANLVPQLNAAIPFTALRCLFGITSIVAFTPSTLSLLLCCLISSVIFVLIVMRAMTFPGSPSFAFFALAVNTALQGNALWWDRALAAFVLCCVAQAAAFGIVRRQLDAQEPTADALRRICAMILLRVDSYVEGETWYRATRVREKVTPRIVVQSRKWLNRSRDAINQRRKLRDPVPAISTSEPCLDWSLPVCPISSVPSEVAMWRRIADWCRYSPVVQFGNEFLVIATTVLTFLDASISQSVLVLVVYTISAVLTLLAIPVNAAGLFSIVGSIGMLLPWGGDVYAQYRYLGVIRILTFTLLPLREFAQRTATIGVLAGCYALGATCVAFGIFFARQNFQWTSISPGSMFEINVIIIFFTVVAVPFAIANNVGNSPFCLSRGKSLVCDPKQEFFRAKESSRRSAAIIVAVAAWLAYFGCTAVISPYDVTGLGVAVALSCVQPCAGVIAVVTTRRTSTRVQHLVDVLMSGVVLGLEVSRYLSVVSGVVVSSPETLSTVRFYLHAARSLTVSGSLALSDLIAGSSAIATIGVLLVAGFTTSGTVATMPVIEMLLNPFADAGTWLNLNVHVLWTGLLCRAAMIVFVAYVARRAIPNWIPVVMPPRTAAILGRMESQHSEQTLRGLLESSGALYAARQRETYHLVSALACFLRWFDQMQSTAAAAFDDMPLSPFLTKSKIANETTYEQIVEPHLPIRSWCAGLAFLELDMPITSIAQGRALNWFVEVHIAHRSAVRFQSVWRMFREIKRFEQTRSWVDTLTCRDMRKRFRFLKMICDARFFIHPDLRTAIANSRTVHTASPVVRQQYHDRIAKTHASWKRPKTTPFEQDPDPPLGGIWLHSTGPVIPAHGALRYGAPEEAVAESRQQTVAADGRHGDETATSPAAFNPRHGGYADGGDDEDDETAPRAVIPSSD